VVENEALRLLSEKYMSIGEPNEVSDRQINRRVRSLADELGATIRYKNESKFMRGLAKVLFFAPRFNTDTATTIGKTIWLPSREWARDDRRCWMVLAHELVHVTDAIRVSGVLFALSYLFPQCLALLAPLALIPGCGWFLACLAFLAPIPSPTRAHWELRGYGISLACLYWRKIPTVGPKYIIERHFVGPTYYYMWPFRQAVQDKMDRYRWMAAAGTLGREIPIADALHKIVTQAK
jgi:hypothetical protein